MDIDQLAAMGKIYYSGKANAFQKSKYEHIRAELLRELRELVPTARDDGTALYLFLAVRSARQEREKDEKKALEQARANMQSAHNQLLNYDLEAKSKERK